jgi:succinate dehydrogenase / fumarate reductase cytochrome b subunit
LLIGIILHIAKFRFIDYPDSLNEGKTSYYFLPVTMDKGLYTVSTRLGVKLYDQDAITKERKQMEDRQEEQALVTVARTFPDTTTYEAQQQMILSSAQSYEQKLKWVSMLERQKLGPYQVVAVAPDFGTASVLAVRDTFKHPLYIGLYTIFVLAACFHGFNGLWTFCITWGVVLRVAAQQRALRWAWGLMILIAFLGLASIWGTYWLNLKA